MLRRCPIIFQFTLGSYRGPLPKQSRAPPKTKSPSSSSASSSAMLAAQAIANRVVRDRERKSNHPRRHQHQTQRSPQAYFDNENYNSSSQRYQEEEEDDDGDEYFNNFEHDDVNDDDDVNDIPTLAAPVPPDAWMCQPRLLDARMMPTSLTCSADLTSIDSNSSSSSSPSTFSEIDTKLLSPALSKVFRQRRVEWNIKQPTPSQLLALRVALRERRDLCCISPPGTGKTLCYAIPAIQTALEFNGVATSPMDYEKRIRERRGDDDGGGEDENNNEAVDITVSKLQARDMSRQQKREAEAEATAAECRYCGLDVRRQRVCPSTGAPHPPVSALMQLRAGTEEQQRDALASSAGRGLNRDPSRIAEPSALILCPTGVLVEQVHRVFRALHCGLRIALLRSAITDEDRHAEMLRMLPGCDILISTPASALALLSKNSLKLHNVRFVALDEIDQQLELPHYDVLNMILARLPTNAAGRLSGSARRVMKGGGGNAGKMNHRAYYENKLRLERQHQQLLQQNQQTSQRAADESENGENINTGNKNSDLQRSVNSPLDDGVAATTAGVPRVQRMLVGATLPKPLVPFVSKLLHPHTSRWLVASVLPHQLKAIVPGGGQLLRNQQGQSSEENRGEHEEDGVSSNFSGGDDLFGGKTAASSVTHTVVLASHLEKTDRLRALFDAGHIRPPAQKTIIFCNSRSSVHFLADNLPSTLSHLGHDSRRPVRVVAITPGQRESARNDALAMFQRGGAQVLVTTDVLARGIDFDNTFAVVHYDFPHHFDSFVHRSGRCGRKGKRGHNFIFFEPQDARMAKRLVAFLQQRRQDVPALLLRYARRSWTELYRESVHGMAMRRFNPKSPDAKKHPLGLGGKRYPSAAAGGRENARRFRRSVD